MRLYFALFCLLFVLPVYAQEENLLPVAPQVIEISAVDGLGLVGDFYLVDSSHATVVLLHELYTTRASWLEVIRSLLNNGYNVLAVDERGFGDTGGSINWYKAVGDVAAWMAWLRDTAGVNPNAIHTLGSSIGSSLAILGCANDSFCRSAIAISPGWNYYRQSLANTIAVKPVLAIYARRDRWPSLGIPRMQEAAPDSLTVQAYEGNAHGMHLLSAEFDTMLPLIVEWLAAHSG
jgi:pimeloyl-ACP methyl ester carboxylesterase